MQAPSKAVIDGLELQRERFGVQQPAVIDPL
jgi:hypothetical protein